MRTARATSGRSRARLRDAVLGVALLVVVASLVLLSVLFYTHAFTDYVTVRAETASVGNALQKGSDVKVRGVLVGSVSGTSTNGRGTVVDLDLDPGKARSLPSDVTVRLLPKTLFGERYVSLQIPSGGGHGHLRSGDTIHQDTSPAAVELNTLFGDLLPVLQTLQPEKLSSILGSFATTLRGQGDDLYSALSSFSTFVSELAPHVPQLGSDLRALATVARTYTGAAPDLVQALNSITDVSRTIVRRQADFRTLVTTVTSTSNVVGDFVGTNQNSIIGLAADSLPTLRTLAAYSGEFPCLSRTLANFVPVANKAFGAGSSRPGAHVVLHVVNRVGAYTTNDRPTTAVNRGSARCPYSPTTALAGTALAEVPGVTGANLASPTGSTAASSTTASSTTASSGPADAARAGDTPQTGGMGPANSPQENQLIAELVAPVAGVPVRDFPDWGSLLLGPALRGTQVSLR